MTSKMAPKGSVKAARRIDIKGQGHMLAYITKEEAELLKAHGGSGKPGPKGIPSFEPGDDGPNFPTFYHVPVGPGGNEQTVRRVYIGSSQDTMANRQAGSSDLANRVQDEGPGYLPRAFDFDIDRRKVTDPKNDTDAELPDVPTGGEGGDATDDAKYRSKMGKESTIATTSQGLLKKAKTRNRSLMTGLIS
jgi:hypothetical protein